MSFELAFSVLCMLHIKLWQLYSAVPEDRHCEHRLETYYRWLESEHYGAAGNLESEDRSG